MTFKPGDKIFIEPSQEYPEGKYILARIYGQVQLVNLDTGMLASHPIIFKNENAITDDEMNEAYGIKGFRWHKI